EPRRRPRLANARPRDDVTKRSLLDDSHRVVRRAVGTRADVVDRNDARMLELRGDARLFDESRRDDWIARRAWLQRLERDESTNFTIERGDDLSDAARAELFVKGVARTDELARQRLRARRRHRALIVMRDGLDFVSRREELSGLSLPERRKEIFGTQRAA